MRGTSTSRGRTETSRAGRGLVLASLFSSAAELWKIPNDDAVPSIFYLPEGEGQAGTGLSALLSLRINVNARVAYLILSFICCAVFEVVSLLRLRLRVEPLKGICRGVAVTSETFMWVHANLQPARFLPYFALLSSVNFF